jgi:hypothetical protein
MHGNALSGIAARQRRAGVAARNNGSNSAADRIVLAKRRCHCPKQKALGVNNQNASRSSIPEDVLLIKQADGQATRVDAVMPRRVATASV